MTKTLLKGTLIDTTSTDDITNTSSLDGGTLTETLENLAEADVVHKAGEETITGPKLFTATTTFQGDVIQQGTTYTTHTEQVYTTKDTIIMRDGALTGLADGTYSGLTAKLYDGVNDGQLVFDNKGVARVGDVGSLQPLATREETPTDGYYAKWSYANQRFETTQVHSDEVVNDSNGVGTNVSDVLDGIISGSQELDHISLSTTPTPISNTPGKLIWNDVDQCLDVYDGETKNQVGQESVVPVRNNTGAKLLNGKVVCITGSDGYYPTIELADAETYSKADSVVGVLSQDIENGAIGKCTFNGKVRDLDTSLFNNGDTIWLSETPGAFTNVMPSHPSLPVRLGQVIEADATDGSIFVKVDFKPELLNFQIYKEPTGFFDPDNVIVSYDSTTRKVTLTGNVEAYWRGKHIPILTSGWISDAHPDVNGTYYLYYDGDLNIFSFTTTPWSFDKLMIAFINYGATYKWAIRECHGTMDWKSHQEFHRVIGTYKESGGELSNYVLNSTTAANRRPYVSATYIFDEDIRTINPALTTNSYTIANLTGADATNAFALSQTDIVPLSGSNPYYNQWNGSTWTQTLMANNSYMNVYLLAIPTTADSESQSYRYMWVQGQNNGDLPTVNAYTTKDLNIGSLTLYATEIIFIAKVTIRYRAADWSIVSVTNLTGSSFSQIGTPSGSFLASVSTDATLTGNGTLSNPLSVVQNYATLTGDQTVAGNKTFSSTIVGSISGNAGTATTATNVSGGSVSCTTFTSSSTNTFNALTATTVPYLNASKQLVSSSVSPTELGYVSGVTSSIQTQLNSKGSGTVTSVAAGNGMSFTTFTSSGTITMGTPSSVTATSTNSVASGTHTHAVSGLTTSNLSASAGITNAQLAKSSVTIGTTAISLGSSSTTLAGLTSVAATTFTGALSGNASTATNANHAETAETATKVSNALTVNGKTYDGSSAVNAGVQTIENGGTGASNGQTAFDNIVSGVRTSTNPADDETMLFRSSLWYKTTVSNFWEYIKGKISSVLGLTASSYGGKSAKSSFLDEYVGAGGTRPTSGNIKPKDATEYGGMRKDVVTSSMTDSGIPNADGHLLTMFWDNSGRYDSQVFVSESNPPAVKVRAKANNTDYGSWIDVITSNNIGSQTVTWSGIQTFANGIRIPTSQPSSISDGDIWIE